MKLRTNKEKLKTSDDPMMIVNAKVSVAKWKAAKAILKRDKIKFSTVIRSMVDQILEDDKKK